MNKLPNFLNKFIIWLFNLCPKHKISMIYDYCWLCELEDRQKHPRKLTRKEFNKLYKRVSIGWDEYSDGIKLKKDRR